MDYYPHLFKSLKTGSLSLPNRVWMAPLTRNRAHPDGTPSEMMATYYKQRAGAGLIIAEATQISAKAKGYLNTPGIYTPEHIAAWKKITSAVHEKNGHIFLQLWHVGRISHISLQEDGTAPVAPSAITAKSQTFTQNGFEDVSPPRALKIEEIPNIIKEYVHAAKCAKDAGFDGIEIHSANGYLLDQFLQDGSNKRDDSYGGSIENRMRLLNEVIDAVSEIWPSQAVGVRLSPLGQANDIKDSDAKALFTKVYESLSTKNLAYLHVIEDFFRGGGTSEDETRLINHLRKFYKGVYVANGDFDAAKAEKHIQSNKADAITFGRPFIANPDLVERYRQNSKLNAPDEKTFYGGGEKGYTDYPFLNQV